MSQVQMAGHYGNFVYVPRLVVGYSRGNPPKEPVLPPTIGPHFRSLVFRPRYLVRSRGNPVFPGVPNTAPLVFAPMETVSYPLLELTLQPPSVEILPTVPTMATWVYSQAQKVAYPLLDLTVQPPFFLIIPPTMASWVFAQLQRVEAVPLELTVQPPFLVVIPPVVPLMGFFYTMNPAILAQLLIRGFITPSQLFSPPKSPLFGREELAEHRQYTNFANQAGRFA